MTPERVLVLLQIMREVRDTPNLAQYGSAAAQALAAGQLDVLSKHEKEEDESPPTKKGGK